MAITGYARTSTREQKAGLQADYSSTASLPGAVDMGGGRLRILDVCSGDRFRVRI
jgi:hypothetical protein